MHASLHKSRRENHRRVVFTQQDTIYSRTHLVLTNLLITSLLVLCFSRWFLLFLPPNILLISCHPRLLFWYLLFRYRWAHHLCFLSMNDLSRSSFFDLSIFLPPKILLISCCPIDSYSDICYLGTDELIIFVSFIWMICVDLPFLIYSGLWMLLWQF